MKTESEIPFALKSLDSKQAGELLGCSRRHVAEVLAKLPGFPANVAAPGSTRPRWVAGELIEWRDSNPRVSQASRKASRR